MSDAPSDRSEKRHNAGTGRLADGTTCCTCALPIRAGAAYVVHEMQTGDAPPARYVYHPRCFTPLRT